MSLSKGPTLNVGSKAAIPSVFYVVKTLTKPCTSHHHHHRNKIHLQTHTLPHLNSKALTLSSSKPSHYQKQNLDQLTKSQNQSIQSRIVGGKTRRNRRENMSQTKILRRPLDSRNWALWCLVGEKVREKGNIRESKACLVLKRVEWRVRGGICLIKREKIEGY